MTNARRPRLSARGLTGGMDSFIRRFEVRRGVDCEVQAYPFNIPAISRVRALDLHPQVTFLIGDNGSGKSTLVEALAIAAGFNAEGGSRHFRFSTRASESILHKYIRLSRGTRRPRTGFFLRAESYFNVASSIEKMDRDVPTNIKSPPIINAYGGVSLHELSHGESFLRLVTERFSGQGLYLLDEPEAALSPNRQLTLLKAVDKLVREKSQFVIATHSPILLAYPNAFIFQLNGNGVRRIGYEQTEHYSLTKAFLADHRGYVARLLE